MTLTLPLPKRTHSAMRIKVQSEHARQLQQLDMQLSDEIARALEDTSRNGCSVLDRLSAIAASHLDDSTTLELAVHMRRRVLAAQWDYLSQRNAPSQMIRRVIDELDVIGYEHPATWADIRLELAAQYERESNHEAARAIRAEVRGEARRIVSELQLLKHV